MNGKQSSHGMKVRDMVRRFDTAINSDAVKSSFSSIGPTKSSYFGLNQIDTIPDEDEDDFEGLYGGETRRVSVGHQSPTSPSRSSNGSQKTVRQSSFEAYNDIPAIPLDNQKSFMNLSRSKEPPRPAPREKKSRQSIYQHTDDKVTVSDVSYPSKTIISKTPNGVRIIVDIFFDQNKGIAIEDVVGSRIETDIPPSKILKEFQERVAESSQD
ncbi:uncharacterized protein LOC129940712 isoform X2 [Eupeodes corollae]|uniref:uncharacterized protein LOC129940712 isoform X2 n=1 Tax=Eupeodes corollae TaxID=290404 RepID=UPI0024921E48|nr:uncharacterized protein LOC129940712 isoform X2 [Eupeodes corollae]